MTATTQPESKSPSRRALLAGALGGIGAWTLSAIHRVPRIAAADGDAVTVGNSFVGTGSTRISNVTNALSIWWGDSLTGTGVRGSTSSGFGVWGEATAGYGVYGTSSDNNAVYGLSSSASNSGVWGNNDGGGYGVSGSSAGSAPSAGVFGSNNNGYGVRGATTSGHGVHGSATSGFAGYFAGKVYTTKFHEMKEISAPDAPAANKARLFVRDNGSGKTQLCVRFNTGGVLVIKTQP